MSSLFNDSASCKKATCNGCVCGLLNDLANNTGSMCTLGMMQQVLIIPKGSSAPLDLSGDTVPTVFTVVRFNPETCCATFSYEDTLVTRPYISDCRSIAGIVCLNNGN